MIVSKWEIKKDRILYDIQIPPNSTATLHLPAYAGGGEALRLESGKHALKLRFNP